MGGLELMVWNLFSLLHISAKCFDRGQTQLSPLLTLLCGATPVREGGGGGSSFGVTYRLPDVSCKKMFV